MKLRYYLYYSEDKVKLYNANCIDVIQKLPDNYVDLICTDPPYGYSFMGKDWDKVVIPISTWKECLRVLKPGALAFIMSAPRQDVLSRMIYNLQEAGFETGFSSIYWSYASGFPKASNISKMVDKRKGITPDQSRKFAGYIKQRRLELKLSLTKIDKYVCNGTTNYSWFEGRPKGQRLPRLAEYQRIKEILKLDNRFDKFIGKAEREVIEKIPMTIGIGGNSERMGSEKIIDKPSTTQAKELDGSYGGFQPKPAVEIIIVAMKPLSEKTYVDQALKNGKGITWLDNCRVPYINEKDIGNPDRGKGYPVLPPEKGFNQNKMVNNITIGEKGRFPANLLVSDDVLNDGKIERSRKGKPRLSSTKNVITKYGGGQHNSEYNDSGSYSRYFDLDAWWRERIKKLPPEVQKVFPYLIVPKASKSEKNKGLIEKGTGSNTYNRKCLTCGKWQRKQGLTDDYTCHCKKPNWEKPKGNLHPTVKPIKLMSYLITLGSREKDIVLDPFVGSGTTGISAKFLNRKFIGIEMSEEYCKIAKARIKGRSK